MGRDLIRCREFGSGPTLVFVPGILASGVLWREVVAGLSGRFRCVVLDLPLGGHAVPMSPVMDLSPQGVARRVAEFVRRGSEVGARVIGRRGLERRV